MDAKTIIIAVAIYNAMDVWSYQMHNYDIQILDYRQSEYWNVIGY